MKEIFRIKDFFEENESVKMDYYIEHRDIFRHAHEFWELSYVCESQGKSYVEEEKPVEIGQGSYLLIAPGCFHCITSPGAEQGSWVKVCNLLIKPEYMGQIIEKIRGKHDVEECILLNRMKNKEVFCVQLDDENETVQRMLLTAMHEHKYPSWGSRDVIENCVENIVITSIRAYEQKKNNTSVTATKHEVIDNLIRYIRINFRYPITLEYLAAYAHLSPEYLARYFKKCTGTTIFTFLTDIRMEHARLLLRTTTETVSEVSISCGYQSVGNFQKAFKKAEGISAGEYRNRINSAFLKQNTIFEIEHGEKGK